MDVNRFDIAVINVSESIGRITNENVRREPLNCVTKFYSSSLKAVIGGTARFVF
jgi:hypothetical protein